MRIELREYGPEAEIEIAADIAGIVSRSGLVDVLPLGGDRFRVVPTDRVGAVRVGEWEVVVNPKVGTAGLLFLLGYAADPGFHPEDVSGIATDDLLPVLAESLTRQVERATRQGVLQGYVTVEDALPLVRGRIRAADHMARRPGMLLPVEVTYDEYSPDIAENRILRTAVRRMMTVPRVRPEIRLRLGHLDGRLNGVTPLVSGAHLPAWLPTRLNARYVPALRLAELVLRYFSASAGPGGVPIASFVVNMAKVFEDFVTTALREAAADLPGRIAAQYSVPLTADGRVNMYPDVVYLERGLPCAVFDAKYKIEGIDRGVPNADLYQMLAYCTALDLPRGYLVYAKGQEDAVTHRVVNTSPPVEIVQHPLDVAQSPNDLLGQITTLVDASMGRSRYESASLLAR